MTITKSQLKEENTLRNLIFNARLKVYLCDFSRAVAKVSFSTMGYCMQQRERKNIIILVLAWAIDLHMRARERTLRTSEIVSAEISVISAELKQMFVIFFVLNNFTAPSILSTINFCAFRTSSEKDKNKLA